MTPWQRLQQRIAAECEVTLPKGAVLRRSYAGRHQMAAGACRWWVEGSLIHSYQTVGELLRAKRLRGYPDRDGGIEIVGENR